MVDESTIEISLPENPSTGYRWMVAPGSDIPLSTVFIPTPQPENGEFMVGAGGTAKFLFAYQYERTTKVKLSLRRPWETDEPPVKVFEATYGKPELI